MTSIRRITAFALFLLLAPAVTAGGGAAHPHPHSEESFQKIEPAQPTSVEGKIEVLEIFWYGCPHCYAFEPYLDNWNKTRPADVEFVRMPGVLNPSWIQHARAYYTAQKLGVLDKIHMPLFDAIHRDRQRIFSEDELREFFTDRGVDGDDFDRVFRSSEVDTRMKQALFTARNARVTGVPTIIVNGRYMTSGTMTGSFEKMLEVTDQLIAIERERLGMPTPPPAAAAPAPTPAAETPAVAATESPVVAAESAPAAATYAAPVAEAAPTPAAQAPAEKSPLSRYLVVAGLLAVVIGVVFALMGRRGGAG